MGISGAIVALSPNYFTYMVGRALIGVKQPEDAKRVLQAGIDAAVSGRSNGGRDLVPDMQALLRSLG